MQSQTWVESRRASRRSLLLAPAIRAAFFLVEVVGGLLTNSLAVLADAGHVLTDVSAIGVALLALRFADRPISARLTFGSYRVESFAAVANGILLWIVAVWIAFEGYSDCSRRPRSKACRCLPSRPPASSQTSSPGLP